MNQQSGILQWLFLKKWHPVPTVGTTIALFGVVGVIFVVLGIVITVINNRILEFSIYKYDNQCTTGYGEMCTFTAELTHTMTAPIYFYYELENFYQNHRRYVKSKSSAQLSGDQIGYSIANQYCDPVTFNKDLFDHQKKNYIDSHNKVIPREKGKELVDTDIASPCGLIAKSFFNDTYALSYNKVNIPINETEISWPNDKGKKYKEASNSAEKQWISPENEHFIVWMRTAGLPQFRKLWGRIENDLEPGTYTFTVQNNYNPKTFAGSKNIILSTSGPFGGKNLFLSVAFIVVGVIQLLIALAFLIENIRTGGRFGGKNKE